MSPQPFEIRLESASHDGELQANHFAASRRRWLRCGSSQYSRYSCVAGALPATTIDGNLLNATSMAVH
jgi:hypothetical protein